MLPDTEVTVSDAPPSRSAPTDTGVWFVAGFAEKGPAEPVAINGMSEYLRVFGKRTATSAMLSDSLEAFFREGGNRAVVSRVFGPNPVLATVTLQDSGPANTLVVNAKSAGDWGNKLNVAVVAGVGAGTFVLVVTHDDDGELERSPDLADKTAAFEWAESATYINLVDVGTSVLDPAVVAAQSLTGGTDDHTNATDATWKTALNLMTKDLGPGQVSMPGRTSTQAQSDQIAHAAAHNRVPLLDVADTATVNTLTAQVTAQRSALPDDVKRGSIWGPWAVIPGVVPATTRDVPYSAIQAGLIARSDVNHSPNVPAAGENGQARFAIGLKREWTDAEREQLNDGGVNVARLVYGGIRTYGYRSMANPLTAKNWLPFNNVRLLMAIKNRSLIIAERFQFSELDGKRRKIAQFGNELRGLLLGYYDEGSLFGDSAEEAFLVDVGPNVNTDESLADRVLKAKLAVKASPFNERTEIEITKVETTEAI